MPPHPLGRGSIHAAVGKEDSRSGGRGKMQKAAFSRGRRGRVRSLVHAGFRAGVRGHLPRNRRLAENLVKSCKCRVYLFVGNFPHLYKLCGYNTSSFYFYKVFQTIGVMPAFNNNALTPRRVIYRLYRNASGFCFWRIYKYRICSGKGFLPF